MTPMTPVTVTYNGRTYIIRTELEAIEFCAWVALEKKYGKAA